jgi:nickel-dependent lactate racemase
MTFKTIEIPYSNTQLNLQFPQGIEVDIFKPLEKTSETNFDFNSKIKEIQKDPFWFNIKNQSVLIVVNDASRATPTYVLLKELIPFFNNLSISYDFILATGSHRKPTLVELEAIFENLYNNIKDKILIHNAKDDSNLVEVGKTSFNTTIKLNKALFDKKYSGIITLNSIEPHYFAGWTGGRKSIVPGLAGYETITKTHIHALSSESKNCRLAGNPVHDDLQEGFDLFMKMIDKSFYTFQFVLDSQGTIHELFAGDYSVFNKGVAFASQIFQVPLYKEYEFVIAVAFPPLDQNLYQAHKALENSKQSIKKSNIANKSIFLLVAACEDGIGPNQFLIPFQNLNNLPLADVLQTIKRDYKLGFHKAGKILEAEEYAKLYVYSQLDPSESLNAHFESIDGDINSFIDEICKKGNIKKIALVLDACVTVPTMN